MSDWVGGVPSYEGDNSLVEKIQKLKEEGKIVVLSTSVPHEGSNMEVYQVGNEVKGNLNLLENYNMTTEATVCKMMWITAITKNAKESYGIFIMKFKWKGIMKM